MSGVFWRIVAAIVAFPPVADWIIARAKRTPYTEIAAQDDPSSVYMRRFWLFNPYRNDMQSGDLLRVLPWCPISIRVHQILRPDSDRHLHDHPWNARTIILRGCYGEEREGGAHAIRAAGDTAALRFGEYHRINWIGKGDPDGATTLFITGRKRGTWGFKVDGAKVPHGQYLGG